MSRILWIVPPAWSAAQQRMVTDLAKGTGLSLVNICWLSAAQATPAVIAQLRPALVVINDLAVLKQRERLAQSLMKYRGSIYHDHPLCVGTPALVIDNVLNTREYSTTRPQKTSFIECQFAFRNDLMKAERWRSGCPLTRPRPSVWVPPPTAEGCAIAQQWLESAATASFTAVDIETLGTPPFITCIGFAVESNALVLPFFDPRDGERGRAYWPDPAHEVRLWQAVRTFLEAPCAKAFQNYTYDCLNLLRYRIAVRNPCIDTMHMWHCWYHELPKSLDYIDSILWDDYCYWKDDIKGDKEKADRIPSTEVGFRQYLDYNGQDVVTTWWIAQRLFQLMPQWAWTNYRSERRIQYVYNAQDMIGMRADPQWLQQKCTALAQDSANELAVLRQMAADADFNPNSSAQVATLLYDVFRCPLPKKKRGEEEDNRTVGEAVLKNLQFHHPVVKRVIEQIWDTKKPQNNATKYGSLRFPNGRFYSGQSALTETGRPTGGSGPFFMGTNPLNIPKKMRQFLRADEGYFLVDADFAQADAYFVAFESEAPLMIQNMLDDRDTHCVHAAHFFKRSYEELIAHKKEEWVGGEHGIRSIGKRVVHGSNYRMAAFTLYMTMGLRAVEAAAKALDMRYRTEADLVLVCEQLLQSYHDMYPEIRLWFDRIVSECATNGDLATCFGGLTRQFLADVRKNQKAQRELSAFYGQGGTAGLMRRAETRIFYESDLLSEGLLPLREVYDSFVFQVPIHKPRLVEKVLTIMEEPCTVRGREFFIPAAADFGWAWGKEALQPWRRGLINTAEDVLTQLGQQPH